MFKFLLFSFLLLTVVGGSLLPPSPLLLRGEHKPFYLQYLSEDNQTVCHCPNHDELHKAFKEQAQRNGGKIYYMVSCGGDFSQLAASIFKDIAPMGAASRSKIALSLMGSLIPSNSHYPSFCLNPPEKPPRIS